MERLSSPGAPADSPTNAAANSVPAFLLQVEAGELERLRASIASWTPAAQKAVRVAVSPFGVSGTF